MKKRTLSILLILCMLLSLLPAAALASGNDTGMAMVTSYEELKAALQDSTVTQLTIYPQWQPDLSEDVYTYFTWPTGDVTLNLDAANETCSIYLGNGTWTIPENVTVNAYDTVYIGSPNGTDMVINGTWNCMSNQAIIGNISGSDGLYGSLTVNGTLTVAKDLRVSPAQVGSFTLNGTLENAGVCYINHMTMADGAEVVNIPNPEIVNSVREIYLVDGGSITGPGTGSAAIGGQITVYKTGTLSGNLTADRITLYNGSTLNVAAGADVTIHKLGCNGTSSSPAAINVDGELSITTDGYNTVSNTTITLGENGVLALSPNVQFGSSSSNSTIEGDGTLELYGILREWDDGTTNCEFAPQILGVDSRKTENGSYVPLTGVDEENLTVKRMWDACTGHSWGEKATVAPTCGARGYDTATCSQCGTEKRSNYKAPTGAHKITYQQNGTSGATATCSECGATGMVSISVPESSYAATGEAITPAVLSKMGSLGESIPDAEITYTDNVEPGTATASATYGDVTISVTFEISECAHENVTAATCTTGPTCADCGKVLGDPLGHTGGTATCREQATCTRCWEKYGDLAEHTYVLVHNDTMHWVECSVCGLECVEDYGISVENITDETRLELIYAYFDQQGEKSQDQMKWAEEYAKGNVTVSQHAYSGTFCTEAGACLLCGYEKAGSGHNWGDWTVTQEATCTEAGSREHTCSDCNATEEEVIPAKGHTEETIPGTAATCTEAGLTDGKKCTVCTTVTVEQTVIPATGHTEVVDAAVPATCTTDGKTAGSHCSVCGTVIVEQTAIPATGHTELTDPAVEPTCTGTGRTEGSHCSVCGAVIVAQESIPALGHDLRYAASGAVITETCSRCGYSISATPDEPEVSTSGDATVARVEATAATSGTTTEAAVSQDALNKAIETAENAAGAAGTDAAVEIVVNTPAMATEVQVDLPAKGLENFADSEAQALTVSSGVGCVTISPEAAAAIAGQAQGDTVTVTISELTQPGKALNERQLAAVCDATVYDLSVTSDGEYITEFGGGRITVSLPYTLKADEDPNGVVVSYVDDLGNLQRILATYDVKTQSVIFTTNHFSFYTVRYDSDAAAAARFTDVPFDAYCQRAVGWAVSHGVTSGATETTFAPGEACTRAQAVTFLWRAAGSPVPKGDANPFADVKVGAYYYDAVLWAVENGITSGTSATTFSPDATCTRAQIVTFLWRSQASPSAGAVNPFADVAADAFYASAVLWAVEHGITAGTSADTFSPNANCTRAQIVTFLWRCMGK